MGPALLQVSDLDYILLDREGKVGVVECQNHQPLPQVQQVAAEDRDYRPDLLVGVGPERVHEGQVEDGPIQLLLD